MQTVLIVMLMPLLFALAAGLLGFMLRPRQERDVMRQVVGDAPHLPRGGYAATDEREPIGGASRVTQAKRPS